MPTAITNIHVFDGENVLEPTTVVFDKPIIVSIGKDATIPANAELIDGSGMTLLPGLIDAHVHTKIEALQLALKFGVTTELEMMGHWTPEQRKELEERDDVADMRTAGFGLTAPGGHPSELFKKFGPPPGVRGPPPMSSGADAGLPAGGATGSGPPHRHPPQRWVAPTASTPEEAVEFVRERVRDGADYVKIMIEEGSVLDAPNLPVLSDETLQAAIDEAHRLGKTVLAHALTLEATDRAVRLGVDGLAHLFLDVPHTDQIVKAIADAGVFVTPCLVLNASIIGTEHGRELAADPRVSDKLDGPWLKTLQSSFLTYPQGKIQTCFATIRALHAAGVDILVGTDASVPSPQLGGLVHGASVHHEMQLLVEAGMSELEALRSATAVPARKFGLSDRGSVKIGSRADLVMVKGDPTSKGAIGDSLNIEGVWRRGVRVGLGAE